MGSISEKSSWNASFEQKLRRYLPRSFELVINRNRCTFLSLSHFRFSVHEMFLEAPEPVIKALAYYALGKKRKSANGLIRRYIQTKQQELDYRDRVQGLVAQGRVYNLQEIYDELNGSYFDGALALKIGWFGIEKKRRRRITFGQYLDAQKVVKIHRMLDDDFYPFYFVSFVVYHEMLHAVIPGYHDQEGRFRIHGPEFKERERAFHAYARARRWEKENREEIFGRT